MQVEAPGAFSETEASSPSVSEVGSRATSDSETDGRFWSRCLFQRLGGDGARAVQHLQARGQLEVLAEVPTGLESSNPKPAFPRSPNFSPNRENEFSIRWWIPIPSSRPCIRTISKYLKADRSPEPGSADRHRSICSSENVAFPCRSPSRGVVGCGSDHGRANPR